MHFDRLCALPENDENSSSLGTKRILNGDLYVVKCDIRCSSCRGIACLDWHCLDAFNTLDKYGSETIVRFTPNGEIVRKAMRSRSGAQSSGIMVPHTIHS